MKISGLLLRHRGFSVASTNNGEQGSVGPCLRVILRIFMTVSLMPKKKKK